MWQALDDDERDYADSLTRGDTYAAAIAELTRAFEGIDTDEAQILRILRDMAQADREQLRNEQPTIIGRIRGWPLADAAFLRAFDGVLQTGQIPRGKRSMPPWVDGETAPMRTWSRMSSTG